MNRAEPASRGLRAGLELAAVGRARRYAAVTDSARDSDESAGEIWRLPLTAEAVAERLLALSGHKLGGFIDGGRDERGVWLWRQPLGLSLARFLSQQGRRPVEPTDALDIVLQLAECASVCERESLFPGPLEPAGISISAPGRQIHVRADALVAAMLGASPDDTAGIGNSTRGRKSGLSRWLPPAQADGAPWDNAGNRYVIGLIWYQLLAGTHPFSGQGMRRALAERMERGAPPLPDDVTTTLPPGMHSAVTRLLAASPDERPASAKELLERLRDFDSDARDRSDSAPRERPGTAALKTADSILEPGASASLAAMDALRERRARRSPGTRETSPSAPHERRARSMREYLWLLAPVALVAIALALLSWRSPSRAARATAVERKPFSEPTVTAARCAGCHPRQVAEWRRSVMAHSGKSPLFQALEMLIEEQIGKSFACPGGAGILRSADPATACRAPGSNLPITGSGGPLWCVNCHTPGENLAAAMAPWNGTARVSASRQPIRDMLPATSMEGISCAFCHQVHGPAKPGVPGYQGNPFWTSIADGRRFSMRPEDRRGLFGIANSGYSLDPRELLIQATTDAADIVTGGAHKRPSAEARRYLSSSEFCGACHDVRLVGTDVIGARIGEHFKRLRNAYSEWTAWRDVQSRAGRPVYSCQDCHMSQYPGVCAPGERSPRPDGDRSITDAACPPGTHFAARSPGAYPANRAATSSPPTRVSRHYFSGVDVPLAPEFDPGEQLIDDATLDLGGVPLGAKQRRDMLLGATFRFELGDIRTVRDRLEIPLSIANIGAGHRVPAGFSQEREFWVHLRVTDADGRLVYEVGRVERGDQDLADKRFIRVNTDDSSTDRQGRPLGVFGADVTDGPDVGVWTPPPERGGTRFRGRGLINFQNGFLRCVRCIGEIDGDGACLPGPGQRRTRAARYIDAPYDADTGACQSNLDPEHALFEVYFPVGGLDSTRGLTKGPDAIIDTRSLAPDRPVSYTYDLPVRTDHRAPFKVEARLLFRAFPPFLIRAFADYEARQARRGLRPSGPLIDHRALERLDVVEIAAIARSSESSASEPARP